MLARFRAFTTVVDMGSFSSAARALSFSQPAVSKQIAQLEGAYGVTLLDRSRRQLELTEAGLVVYRHAVRMLEVERSLRSALESLSEGSSHRLRIGASSIPGQFILPYALADFLATHPGVRLAVLSGDTDDTRDRLMAGEIDAAVVGAPIEEPGIVNRELFDDEILLIVPHTHPLAESDEVEVEDLLDERFVWRERGSATRAVTERFLGERADELHKVAHLGSTEAVVSAVEAGTGLAFASRWAVEGVTGRQLISGIRISGVPMKRKIFGCHLKTAEHLHIIDSLMTFLRDLPKTMEVRDDL